MPRKPRLQGKGIVHHVIVRGNRQQNIFLSDADRIRYLQLIERYRDRYRFVLLSYCLMDNHVHILLQQGQQPLSSIMQGIQQSYTQFYNRKYSTSGHVFQQRFTSFPCTEEAYLIALIAYIHKNPKAAEMVQRIGDYPWSSHREIVRPGAKNLICVEDLYRLTGVSPSQFKSEYYRMLEEVAEEDIPQQYMDPEEKEIRLGTRQVETLKEKSRRKRRHLTDIREAISEFEKNHALYLSKAEYRKIFTVLSFRHCAVTGGEVANALGVNPSRISQIRNEYREDTWTDRMNHWLELTDEKLRIVKKDDN